MSLSPIPDLPFTLPPTHFSVPAATIPGRSTLPHLRAKIVPTILVPSQLVSERAHGRKVEECLEIVVPVGGKVGFGVNLEEEGTQLLTYHGDPLHPNQVHHLERTLQSQVKGWLVTNASALGISRFSKILMPHPSTPTYQDMSRLNFNAHPVTAEPTHSPLHKNTLQNGIPLAHLDHIQITFQYVMPRAKTNKQDEEPQQQSQVGAVGTMDDDEDMLVEDDEEDVEPVDSIGDDLGLLHNDVELSHEPRASRESPSIGPSLEPKINLSPERSFPPPWSLEQVSKSVQRLLRVHLIKRFPLIFDELSPKYTASYILPASLASAFSLMLNNSKRFKTPLVERAIPLLKTCIDEEEETIKDRVRVFANLSGAKAKRRRLEETEPPTDPGTKGRKKRKRKTMEVPVEPAEDYICRLREQLVQLENSTPRRSQEKKLRRVLNDALGRIGGMRLLSARAALGKLAIHKIALDPPSDLSVSDELDNPAGYGLSSDLPDPSRQSQDDDDLLKEEDDLEGYAFQEFSFDTLESSLDQDGESILASEDEPYSPQIINRRYEYMRDSPSPCPSLLSDGSDDFGQVLVETPPSPYSFTSQRHRPNVSDDDDLLLVSDDDLEFDNEDFSLANSCINSRDASENYTEDDEDLLVSDDEAAPIPIPVVKGPEGVHGPPDRKCASLFHRHPNELKDDHYT